MMKLLAAVAFLSALACAHAQARDLVPYARIGHFYCYEGWTGDGSIGGHAILTDRPMNAQRAIDEGTSDYRMKTHTKFVDVDIWENAARQARWNVRYNNRAFYRSAHTAALQCIRKVAPYTVREYPLRNIIARYTPRLRV